MKLSGKLIYLVPFEEIHFNTDYLEWLRDIDVIKYIGREEYLLPIHTGEIEKYIKGLWANPYCGFFSLYRSDEKRFIGTAKVSFGNEEGYRNRIADLGIMIGDKKSWGLGFATDCISVLARYAFNTLGVRKLTAGAVSSNVAVIKAFKKLGFIEEGRLRKKVFVSGGYDDHVLMGCFHEELKEI